MENAQSTSVSWVCDVSGRHRQPDVMTTMQQAQRALVASAVVQSMEPGIVSPAGQSWHAAQESVDGSPTCEPAEIVASSYTSKGGEHDERTRTVYVSSSPLTGAPKASHVMTTGDESSRTCRSPVSDRCAPSTVQWYSDGSSSETMKVSDAKQCSVSGSASGVAQTVTVTVSPDWTHGVAPFVAS